MKIVHYILIGLTAIVGFRLIHIAWHWNRLNEYGWGLFVGTLLLFALLILLDVWIFKLLKRKKAVQ